MKWLKNPMSNAFFIAAITAIYAAIFIVASEFIMNYKNLLSSSWWANFIASGNLKFVGLIMIGVAIIIDGISAMRGKRYDEYQILSLERGLTLNGLFAAAVMPLSLMVLVFSPNHFVEIIFALIFVQWLAMMIAEFMYLVLNYKT